MTHHWIRIGRLASIAILWGISTGVAFAQISPGPLSRAHSDLEGSDQCLKCHSQKKRISADLCLDCHELLRERLDARSGFHATVTDQGCERCHMEHHGLDFELVFWGEEGRAAFDHRQVSFELQGAHASLECRSCHKESLIQDRNRFQGLGKNMDRTFFGLDGTQCLSCHEDRHRGQFKGQSCEACHGLDKWKNATEFQHEGSRFPLVGRHREVACDRCHLPDEAGAPESGSEPLVRYVGLSFASCTDCHKDPHESRLGSSCTQCHSESSWRVANVQSFDHSRTRFPLSGAHRQVQCQRCHRGGLAQTIREFQSCTDCHQDFHLGQFADRPRGSDCESCHSVERFSASSFSLEAHNSSGYPLEGAHLAVACNACHAPLESVEIQRLQPASNARSGEYSDRPRLRYDFPSTLCSDCHTNPHEESIVRFMQDTNCQACHVVAGWRFVEFDHERTDYSLEGGHRSVGCLDCHAVGEPDESPARLLFDGLSRNCAACHRDPHLDQFREAEGTTCTRCHSVASWQKLGFDHNRDSSYSLEGVHSGLACGACHHQEQAASGSFVRYRPLPMTCSGCHGAGDPEGRPAPIGREEFPD